MTKEQLTEQFNILKKDVTTLPDTTSWRRIERIDGRYVLTPKSTPSTNEDRVKRILGAVTPRYTASVLRSLYINTNDRTGYMPEDYLKAEEDYIEEEKLCITYDRTLQLILLLLRRDGVINFGETPLCRDEDPVLFLRRIISESSLTYSDTLLMMLDLCASAGKPLFIEKVDETPSEKLDKAIMLLSLLSPEEIRDFGLQDDFIGLFSNSNLSKLGERDLQFIYPFVHLNLGVTYSLFSDEKINTPGAEKARKLIEVLHDKYGMFEDGQEHIAVDSYMYSDILSLCALSGISCSPWLFNSSDKETLKRDDIKTWVFDRFEDTIREKILKDEDGYYLITLSNAAEYKELTRGFHSADFRKAIVDGGRLTDVISLYLDVFNVDLDFFEIKGKGQKGMTRFFNFCNDDGLCEYGGFWHLLSGFDWNTWTEENKVYRFASAEEIADNDYNLSMDLYNSPEWHDCQNPVRLSDILIPVEGINAPAPSAGVSDAYSYVNRLQEHALDNYNEFLKSGYLYRDYNDTAYEVSGLFLAMDRWPLSTSYFQREKNDFAKGIVIAGHLMQKGVMAFKVDTEIANPWYVADAIEKTIGQFNLRSIDGKISGRNFLKLFIDLPSLAEQRRRIEDKLKQQKDKIMKQLGAAEVLFDLNHTISLPVNRMQMLLGNLSDMNEGKPEIFSQLKKIRDNFDYVLRVIKTFSTDYKKDFDIKPTELMPVIEDFRSKFSSLPFGFDPEIDRSRIDQRIKVKINDDLFRIVLDNIMRNAHRHGFNKSVSPENRVLISFDVTSVEGKNWLLMSVGNNGKAMEGDFTIADYIMQGRKGRTTGNTGQGGYDIYQIVRKFDGRLGIRSSDDWNFIVDILLPLEEVDEETNIKEYRYGPLV